MGRDFRSYGMNREFKFFITEEDSNVEAWAKQKERDGNIFVGNARGLIDQLEKLTEPNDVITCLISGAWLDECVEKSVRQLLHPVGYGKQLPGRTVSGVIVDLTTSVAFSDRELSIGERRSLLTCKLDTIGADPRLIILP